MGHGDGQFESPIYFGLLSASFFRIADLDGDGRADLAVFAPLRKSTYFLRRGAEPMGALSWDDYPFDAQFADFNGDGNPDLIVATLRATSGRAGDDAGAAVLLAPGRGAWLFDRPVKITAPHYPLAEGVGFPLLAVGEFTGDANLDFVLANGAARALQVFRGNGDGTFDQVAEAAGVQALALVSADFDGDGIQDVAVASGGDFGSSGAVTVYFGGRGGAFRESKRYGTCSPLRSLIRGDFNGDSKVDLAAVCGSELTILVNAGSGIFQLAPKLALSSGSHQIAAAAAADLDGDGKQDLAVAQQLNSVWGGGTILLSNGDGTFRPAAGLNLPPYPIALAAEQWSDDGRPGLAVLSAQDATVTVSRGLLSSGSVEGFASGPPRVRRGERVK
jgi:hypothetical protein